MTKEKTHTHILIREIISSINSIDDGTEVFKKLSYQEKEKVIGFILNEMQEIVRKKFEKEKAESVKI